MSAIRSVSGIVAARVLFSDWSPEICTFRRPATAHRRSATAATTCTLHKSTVSSKWAWSDSVDYFTNAAMHDHRMLDARRPFFLSEREGTVWGLCETAF